MSFRICITSILAITLCAAAFGAAALDEESQQPSPTLSAEAQPSAGTNVVDSERWNLYFQATSIGDYHGNFPAKYSGPFSFHNNWERAVSLTTTLF